MKNSIPDEVKKLWDKWNIRGVILFSLSLQTLLIFMAPLRKGTSNKLVRLLIWSAYLLADWAANFAIGLISDSQSDPHDPSTPRHNSHLLALWPPFLLLHLGGPDTITAFSLEDNELWLRHLLGLLIQAAAVVYVFLQSLPINDLAIPTGLMSLAASIKYLERTRALYLASLDRFRESMLKEADPGPNYAKLMEEYASKREAKLPTQIIMISEPDKESKATKDDGNKIGKLIDLEVIHYAYRYFNIFKRLIVDLIFSFRERNESRGFFHNRTPEDAFQVIEVELNFIYQVLYTKVVVVHSMVGYIFRFIAIGSVVSALSLFHFHVDKTGFDKFDIRVTYTLFWGALGLDSIALFMLVFSDWTLAALTEGESDPKRSRIASILSWFLVLKKPRWDWCQHSEVPKHRVLTTPLLVRRWSESISGHSLVRYCLKGCPTRVHRVKSKNWFRIAFEWIISCLHTAINNFIRALRIDEVIDRFGLTDAVDKIRYVSHEPLTKELWEFIFGELRRKSQSADDPEVAKRISSARGDWVLQDYEFKTEESKLMSYVSEVAYEESLLLWHIATELLYHSDDMKKKDIDNNCEFSKVLSDYMLYLLVMQPTMMSGVAGIGKLRFRDTCAEAKRFFQRKRLKPNEERRACELIMGVNTDVKPVTVKGDRSKSVLFDASMLAKELKRLEEEGKDIWKLMSKVWVELLSYSASHCRAITHAQQVSKGGELITFVWLLMAHFGLADQFQINEGHARAKLIVGK